MWRIKPDRDSSKSANVRGYVIAHSSKIAEFIALRNKAIIVECLGPVGTDSQRPFLVWEIRIDSESDYPYQECGLLELRLTT